MSRNSHYRPPTNAAVGPLVAKEPEPASSGPLAPEDRFGGATGDARTILVGQRARFVQDEDLLAETFDAVDAKILGRWRRAETTEARESAWHAQNALADVRKQLRTFGEQGLLTEKSPHRVL